MSTQYHAKLWAHELTLRGATGSIEAISRSIAGSRVDLNPHQVDAALFALRSPLAKGVILADEVGLGKTIEAGIVIAQRWAEHRRRILLIVPATLRKQWQQELQSKFYLPTQVIDSGVYTGLVAKGNVNPFEAGERLVICSYHFASAKSDEIGRIPWDLVVIDEAHRLRNIYKPASRLARRVVDAVANPQKLLLTATPLQNSLMELYGLASVIDAHRFGDAPTFRDHFVVADDERLRNAELRDRLKPICVRTLRKQVTEYIPFTRRVPVTQDFHPNDEEYALYEKISAYLQRDGLIALPAAQRTLITLVLRKLLASSTFAIGNTLERMVARLEKLEGEQSEILDEDDLEGIDTLEDELDEDEEEALIGQPVDLRRLKAELIELKEYAALARQISTNAKGEALIPALREALDRAAKLGAQRKAVIFTESRRTQQYLFDLLSGNGYRDRLAMINGSNSDPHSKGIYEAWRARHAGQEVVSGSRAVDIKAAIVEHFRDYAEILIATEAAAEGVNLQFCSLVVNYDLPWNPQRIEQRIGRCHRYGQKYDVVVVNFLNRRNEADQRVLELLSQKFKLFEGVFGASDEVLGALESGVDIERRIAQVYQTCRNAAQIQAAFDKLQAELDDQIQARMAQTRQLLLENFDEDVSAKLRVHRDKTKESLSHRERCLLELTRIEIGHEAEFDPERPRFQYRGSLAPQGWYHFDWKEAEKRGETFYRQDHALAQAVIDRALGRELPTAQFRLDYSGYGQVVSVLKPLVGATGWLEVSKLVVESMDREEFLVFAGRTDAGLDLGDEVCQKLFLLPAKVEAGSLPAAPDLSGLRQSGMAVRIGEVGARNGKFFDEEVLKLDRWSEDLKEGLERELKELDKEIREARRAAALAGSLQDKLEAQKKLKAMEGTRHKKRRELFDAQDDVDKKRDGLIGQIEKQLQQRHEVMSVFKIRWRLE